MLMDQVDSGLRKGQRGPWLTEIVKGDPIQVAGREIVPLVRVTRRVQRRASLHSDRVGGQGYGLVTMRPIAVLDNGKDGERHQIRNETARAIGGLVLAALLIPLLTTLLIFVYRSVKDRQSPVSSA
jgi:hypothetical protein